MKPILSQVLFKPLSPDEVTEGGLFVPKSAMEVSNKGLIVDVGNGTNKKPMKLKKGLIVYRVKGWGQEVMINNELHFLMDEGAILAIHE